MRSSSGFIFSGLDENLFSEEAGKNKT